MNRDTYRPRGTGRAAIPMFGMLLAASVCLAGCGGGVGSAPVGQNPNPAPNNGPIVNVPIVNVPNVGGANAGTTVAAVRVRVEFPAGGRIVPVSAQSVTVMLKQGSSVLGQATLVRPAGGGVVEHVFSVQAPSTYTIVTTAFGNTTGSGTPLAEGAQIVENKPGEGATLDIAMESTIQSVAITPSTQDVSPGEIAGLSASARNAANQDVLTAPDKWQWSSANSSIATVAPSGATATVRGVSAGTVDIRATETETGKSATFTLAVLKTAPTLFIRSASTLLWYNGRKPVASTRTTALGYSSLGSRAALMPDGSVAVDLNVSVVGNMAVGVVNRTTGIIGPTSTTFGYGSHGVDALLGLPNGRVLAHTTQGFFTIDPNTGVVLSAKQLDVYSRVRDMTIGPDGKVYLTADSRTGLGNDDVITRIDVAANGAVTEEAILYQQATVFGALRFLSDGKLAIVQTDSGTLRLFSVSGNSAVPLGSAESTGGGLGRLSVGRGVISDGDEIVYVLTTNGVRRFAYNNGTFTALDTAAAPYLYGRGDNWDDIVVAP